MAYKLEPLEPLRPIRSLSEQHWIAAEQDMHEYNLVCILAGEQSGYKFFVVREDDGTFRRETYDCGELVLAQKGRLSDEK